MHDFKNWHPNFPPSLQNCHDELIRVPGLQALEIERTRPSEIGSGDDYFADLSQMTQEELLTVLESVCKSKKC